MEAQPVSSSAILSVGYDEGSQTLEIVFVSGRSYLYSGVPAVEASLFLQAASKGKYFNAFIRPKYAYTVGTLQTPTRGRAGPTGGQGTPLPGSLAESLAAFRRSQGGD